MSSPAKTSPAKKAKAASTILVTGGTGLVGMGIQEALKTRKLALQQEGENWVFLSSKDCNLLSMEDTRKLFAELKPTHVIHLAAKVGGLYANQSQKVEFFRENVIMNDVVMECCKEFKVAKLVSCLSTCIFPDKVEYPLTEEKVHLGPPHASNVGYALAKRMIDTLNHCYNEEYGCNFTSIIPTNVYGKHDNFSIETGHVLPGLIHKAYLAKQKNTAFTIWGSGKPLRQFIYNVDLGELIVWTLREYTEIGPIILSVGEEDEVTIEHAARAVVKGMKFTGEVKFDAAKSDGQYRKVASNGKLRKFLPEYKFTTIEDGLAETCAWFEANYASARKGGH